MVNKDKDLDEITLTAYVSNLEYWRVPILIYTCNNLTVFHARQMLDRS